MIGSKSKARGDRGEELSKFFACLLGGAHGFDSMGRTIGRLTRRVSADATTEVVFTVVDDEASVPDTVYLFAKESWRHCACHAAGEIIDAKDHFSHGVENEGRKENGERSREWVMRICVCEVESGWNVGDCCMRRTMILCTLWISSSYLFCLKGDKIESY